MKMDNYKSIIENTSVLHNLSESEQWANLTGHFDPNVLTKYTSNLRVSQRSLAGLLVTYSLLMTVGGAGNGLVLAAFTRNAALRTARNVFLLNLAVADLLLCLITMPLTLLEVVTQHWTFGHTACKVGMMLPAVAVYASTFTIVAIALDRYTVRHGGHRGNCPRQIHGEARWAQWPLLWTDTR